MAFTLLDLVGHLSFGLTAFSFYVRDMLLRTLATASGAVGIVFNYFIPGGPLWLVIFWLCVFMTLNLFRIFTLLSERRRVRFSDEERELAQTVFRNFSAVEFMKLLRIAEWRAAEPGAVLAQQDAPQDELALIYNGEVSVSRSGAEVARGRDGTLIGEMSYIGGGPANATVTVERPTRYLVWPQAALRGLLRRNPTMDVAMQSVFNVDLVRKLGGAT
jgi:hypothetical protein